MWVNKLWKKANTDGQTLFGQNKQKQTKNWLTQLTTLFGQSKFFDIENPDDPNAPELNAVQDILASAVSFSMPLDALTMGFGIRTGGLAARGRFFKGAKAYNSLCVSIILLKISVNQANISNCNIMPQVNFLDKIIDYPN